MADTHNQEIVIPADQSGMHNPSDVISPDMTMVFLTWFTFFILLAILYKFAWKPILLALDAREENIRRSLEDAKKAHEELVRINEESQKIIAAADKKAQEIIERSRKAAVDAAKVIEKKAKEEAHILMDNAESEIEALQKKAQMALRQESVDLAIGLAGKLIQENLEGSKRQKLIDRLIEEFKPGEHDQQ